MHFGEYEPDSAPRHAYIIFRRKTLFFYLLKKTSLTDAFWQPLRGPDGLKQGQKPGWLKGVYGAFSGMQFPLYFYIPGQRVHSRSGIIKKEQNMGDSPPVTFSGLLRGNLR